MVAGFLFYHTINIKHIIHETKKAFTVFSSQTSEEAKDKDLKIFFKDKNQIDGKIVRGLGLSILFSIHSSLVC